MGFFCSRANAFPDSLTGKHSYRGLCLNNTISGPLEKLAAQIQELKMPLKDSFNFNTHFWTSFVAQNKHINLLLLVLFVRRTCHQLQTGCRCQLSWAIHSDQHDHLCPWTRILTFNPMSSADFVSVESLDQLINVPVLFVVNFSSPRKSYTTLSHFSDINFSSELGILKKMFPEKINTRRKFLENNKFTSPYAVL